MNLATLMKSITRTNHAQADYAQLQSEYAQMQTDLNAKRCDLVSLEDRTEAFLDRFEDRPQRGRLLFGGTPNAGRKMSDLDRQQVSAWEREAKQLRSKIQQLESQAADINQQLLNIDQQNQQSTAGLAELKALQTAIDTRLADRDRLQELLEKHQAGANKPEPGTINKLQSQLQAALAGVLIGEAKQADVDTLRQQLADARADYDARCTEAANSAEVLAGLEQRLQDTEQQLQHLQAQHEPTQERAIRGLMLETAQQYRQAAEQTAACIARLEALKRLAPNLSVFVGNPVHFELPALREPFSGDSAPARSGFALAESGHHFDGQVHEALEALRGEMAQAGIVL